MTPLEWNDRYSVGIPDIDAQHCRLVELLNCVEEEMQREKGGNGTQAALHEMTTLAGVIDEMLAYTIYHFSTEEALMNRYKYPEYPSHKTAHSELTRIVQTFRREFDNGKVVSYADLAAVLHAWLVDHIIHADVKLGRFLNDKERPEEPSYVHLRARGN
jgi:hemerythrin